MNHSIREGIREYFRNRQPASAWLRAAALTPLLAVIPTPEVAAQTQTFTLEEIVVTARRRDEGLQEVPLTVNVVNAQALEELNLRRLEDIQAVVPGLTMAADPIAPNASMRGVRFDTFASGFNSTVEFYLNDAPITTSAAMQAMFDIGQIEVLRGPQGTLRGRAAPSGSITITAQRPDLHEVGGHLDVTATNKGGRNYRGALNLPLIEDMLALRVAGMVEENEGSHVKSLRTGQGSKAETDGYRVSLRFEPTEALEFNLMHQRIEPERRDYQQLESARLRDPSQPDSPILIRPGDRHGLSNIPATSDLTTERTSLEVEWDLGGAQLNYTGSVTELHLNRKAADDSTGFFGPGYGEELQNLGQELVNRADTESHEVRLAFSQGLFDFLVGGFYQKTETDNDVFQETPIFFGPPSPTTGFMVNRTPINTLGESREKSVFANVTYRITSATELSAGLRHIWFDTENQMFISGNLRSDVEDDWKKTIYSVSLKHQFTPDMMGYISVGSSWRPGIYPVGNFNTNPSELERSLASVPPETSDSYEIGLKSAWFDNRLRLNGALYYQEFDNYPYRTGGGGAGDGIYYVTENIPGTRTVGTFNFVAPVPVEVYGLELEAFFQATDNWNISAMYSWARGLIDNGTVPCNVYGGQIPTVVDIETVVGADGLATCNANFRSNFAPLWTATLQSEYVIPVEEMEAYVRGLVTLYGDSKNNPTNPYDDFSSYGIVNLYGGLRSADRRWDAMLFVKNLFNTEVVTSRGSSPVFQSYNIGASGQRAVTPYRQISVTAPREVGLNVRYNF